MKNKKIKSKISKGLKATKKEIKRLLNLIKKTPSDKRNQARREKVKTLKKIETAYNHAKTAKNPLRPLARIQEYKKMLRKPKAPKKIQIPPIKEEEVNIKDKFKDLISGKDPLNKGMREAFALAGIDVNNPAQLAQIETLLGGYSWQDLINYIEKMENDFIYEIYYEIREEELGSRNIDKQRIKNKIISIVADMVDLRTDKLAASKLKNEGDERPDEEIVAEYRQLLEDIKRARNGHYAMQILRQGKQYGTTRD